MFSSASENFGKTIRRSERVYFRGLVILFLKSFYYISYFKAMLTSYNVS